MKLHCQDRAFESLTTLKDANAHSILIEGPEGSGKTYLAKMYADMLDASFMVIDNKVDSIRKLMESVYELNSKVVICIENLDLGVKGASYSLLKILEEPMPHVYIIVTCNNIYNVPDTIVSRSRCVVIGHIPKSDIILYAKRLDSTKYLLYAKRPLWRGVKTFKDIRYVFKLTSEQLDHIDNCTMLTCKGIPPTMSISEYCWKLGHFEDNTATDTKFMISCILGNSKNKSLTHHGVSCVSTLTKGIIPSHVALAKFGFEIKYGE